MGNANDFYSSLIHLASAVGFLIASPQLLRALGSQPLRRVGGLIHVFGVVFLLLASGFFHLFVDLYGEANPLTEQFRQLDHIGVWLIMGAFYTLPHILALSGAWRWAPLIVVGLAVTCGVAMKTFWFGTFTLEESFVLYAAVGPVGLASVAKMAAVHGLRFVVPLLWFWACFVGAALSFVLDPPDLIPGVLGAHEFWHLGITLGAVAHWRFVLREARRTGSNLNDDGTTSLAPPA